MMQLTYRGIQYKTAQASGSTNDSGLTATYRGLKYSIPQSNAVVALPTNTLKYRGVVIGTPEVGYCAVIDPAMA